MNNNMDYINLVDIPCEYDNQNTDIYKESEKSNISLLKINYRILNFKNLFHCIKTHSDFNNSRWVEYIEATYNSNKQKLNNKLKEYKSISNFQKKIDIDFLVDFFNYQKKHNFDKFDYIFEELTGDRIPNIGDICLKIKKRYLFIFDGKENTEDNDNDEDIIKYGAITIETLLKRNAEIIAKENTIHNGKIITSSKNKNIFEINSDKEKILNYYYDKYGLKRNKS